MAGAGKWLKAHWDRVLDSRFFKYLVAPFLVTIAASVAVYFLIEFIKDGDDGPPKVRIDTAASLINPADGDDAAEEYVCLVNEEDDAVSLTGWRLTDAEGVVNVLPQFSLGPQAKVRVHPGGGDKRADTSHDLYGSEGASWNDPGDTVTLLDADGAEVDSQPYPERDTGEVRGTCGPPLTGSGTQGENGGETSTDTKTTGETGPNQGPAEPLGEDYDCSDFPTQATAQKFFLEQGGPEEDPYDLDGTDQDGEVCESNP